MINPNWWKTKTQRQFVRELRDPEEPVNKVAKRFNKWVGKKSQEPFAAVIRDALRAGKRGCRSRHKRIGWSHINSDFYHVVFPRVQQFVLWMNYHGKPLSRVIANESIAHRWADFFIFTRKREYERKMVFHYREAHKVALECKSWKNVDSSIFWLADTYYLAAKKAKPTDELHPYWIKKAKKYYCEVANRSGPRFQQSLHRKKNRQATKLCKCL